MIIKPLPTVGYLNECFFYETSTGRLIWKSRPRSHFISRRGHSIFNGRFAGTVAGHKHYSRGLPHSIAVSIDYNKFVAHRIIYAMLLLDVPVGYVIDHVSTNPFDNRPSNLRIATRSQNSDNQNKQRFRVLPKGVTKRGSKFRAGIGHQGEQIHIGHFPTPELAHAAYCAKATELHREFARFQ